VEGPVLVTGAKGFVGRHLVAQLEGKEVDADADVTDPQAIAEAVRRARPAGVVHLAARSSVASSWRQTAEVWRVNVVGTVNLLEAVRDHAPEARVVVVSTADVYGRAEQIPTPEETPVAPLSPYAAAKAASELAAGRAARTDGLDVVVARSFLHAGPGQSEQFAIGSWTRQIARLEHEGGGTLLVGDVSVRRDVLDVRDVCAAYRALLDPSVAAGTYNIATGSPVELEDVVGRLVGMARCPVSVERDPKRRRPADVPVLSGDPARLAQATGWRPRIPLEQTLADSLEDARALAAEERMATA
jgi:GDP-4-dehydro-6-deoxy-D-mannose reductase